MDGGIVALYLVGQNSAVPPTDVQKPLIQMLRATSVARLEQPALAEPAVLPECYVQAHVGLGRSRPALLNQAPQPLSDEARQFCLVFHGELYDLPANTPGGQKSVSPAEFVLHLYQEVGERFVENLNGSFSLALWDDRRQTLIVANDRHGLCPLYHARLTGLPGGEAHVWASRPQAILAAPGCSRQVNLAAMADLLCLGLPQGTDTMFAGISDVPPASLITCHPDRVNSRSYWDLELQEQDTFPDADEILEELIRLLRQAGRRRQTGGNGRPGNLSAGLTLSGGYDSRVLLSLLDPSGLKTFTYGRLTSDDVQFARRAAHTAHVEHTAIEIQGDYLVHHASLGIQRLEDLLNCDQYHGISAYPQIAGQVQAVIAGSAGEDVLGYIDRDPTSETWSSGFSEDHLYDYYASMTDRELQALVAPAYADSLAGLAKRRFVHDFGDYQSRHPAHRHAHWCLRHQQRRLYNRLSSLFPANPIFRPLYLDNDVVDLGLQLPPRLRWGRESLYGRILSHTAPELARLPLTTNHGLPMTATPEQIARRKKNQQQWNRLRGRASRLSKGLLPLPGQPHAYADYATWLRRELRPWAESILLAPRTLDRGYWRPEGVKSLLKDHMQGKGRRSAKKLSALISLELWHRTYLDGAQGKDRT